MMSQQKDAPTMSCPDCKIACQKFGTHRNGLRRFRCPKCKRNYTEPHTRTLGSMYVPWEKALLAIQLLLEGNSILSTERISGLNKNTIMKALVLAGAQCEKVSEAMICNVPVSEVQADEIWSFIGKKEKRVRNGDDATMGDAYCFTAIEKTSKLIVAWHLGRRTARDTEAFTEKINEATAGNFQITTDGFKAYVDAIHMSLGTLTRRRAPLLPLGSGCNGGCPSHRESRPEQDLHIACRTAKPHDEDADSPLHAPDECLQQEIGESLCGPLPVLRLLQFRENPQFNPRYPCHGSRTHRSCVDDCRIAWESVDLLFRTIRNRRIQFMTEDEFWMATKQMMTTFIDTTVRSLYTEITVLSVVLEAIKKSRPEQALIIENLVQMARDSEDTKRSVDQRIEPFLKLVRSLDGPDRDRALQYLMKQFEKTNLPN
jgi:transposase-like protein/IS1 family transposase